MNYGNAVCKYVREGRAKVGPSAWVPLVSSGTTPLSNRQWIEIQHRGQGALALAYANINSDGTTFTTPTHSAQASKIIPANSIKVEPLTDKVNLYGRFVGKAGTSAGGTKVIVTEYA